MDKVDVLIKKCIEKYEKVRLDIGDDKSYGTAPEWLIIEYINAVRKTEHHYRKKYIKSWNYYSGKTIEERQDKDESENPISGMYYARAKALFYFDEEKGKAFIDFIMGPRYARGFVYDMRNENGNCVLENEVLDWVS